MGESPIAVEIDKPLTQSLSSTNGSDSRDGYGLLPRARLRDVLTGKAVLVGARVSLTAQRGWLSPIEARVYLGIPYGDMAAEEERLLAGRSFATNLAVVLRTAIARVLAPRDGLRYERRPHIVSARVDNITIEEALAAMLAPPADSRARVVYIVHPHALNIAAFHPDFADQLTKADLVLPDGIGIRVAASVLGVSMRHNLNGTDLLPLICTAAASAKVPLVLIGGKPGIVDQCATNLLRETRGLQIALAHHGYLDHEKSKEVATRVKAIGRCLVLVGMGSPLQEQWVWEYLREAREATAVTVGGLFDFFSGRIPRAPVAWRELGIEWLWRLRMEPRRLAKRYLLGNPLFLVIALWQRIRGTKEGTE